MDEHIFKRWLDDIHVDQTRAIPADMFDDARQGSAAIVRLHVHFPYIRFSLLARNKVLDAGDVLEFICDLFVPASHLKPDHFLLQRCITSLQQWRGKESRN